MAAAARGKGAHRKVGPFSLRAAALVLLWALSAAVAAVECPADRIDEQARVDHVFDGDTVRLTDGRRVRLIGVNTPEIGRDEEPSEPFAHEAHQALVRLLGEGRIGLRFGTERRDRYDRILAHLYLPNGNSLTARLLEQGFGAHLAVPPNIWNADCYRLAETEARAAGRGLWSLPAYRPVDSKALPRSAQGFRFVEGVVERVGRTKKSVWLNLAGEVAVRIPTADLPYFDRHDFDALVGRRIAVRGWLRRQGKELRMTIRHPASLEIPDERAQERE